MEISGYRAEIFQLPRVVEMGVVLNKVKVMCAVALTVLIVLINCASARQLKNIEESIREDPDLSEVSSVTILWVGIVLRE